MLDGYKTSLSYINSLTWSIFTLSLILLFSNPNTDELNILGINFSQDIVIYIGPIVLVGLLLTRQIIISNAAYIIKSNRSKSELKKLTQSYPLLEFIRWRNSSNLETILISVFHVVFIDHLPVYVILINLGKINQTLWIKIAVALIVVGIVQWNYSTLRRKVYEPLCGKINTVD